MLDRLITPLVTPFNRYNRIDPISLKHLLEHLIRTKTRTVVLCSQLGEGQFLTPDERMDLMVKTCEISAGRLKVYLALSLEGTDRLKDEIVSLKNIPIDGFLLELPKDARVIEDGMKRHLRSILSIIQKPVMIDLSKINRQLVRNTSHIFMTDPNLVGVICDDSELFTDFMKIKPRAFRVYVHDTEKIPQLLEQGADGIYSGLAHLYGETLHTLIQLYKKEQVQEAGLLWDVYADKFRLFPLEHPSYLKAILNYLGYRVGSVRLPLTNLSLDAKQKLIKGLNL